jgi:viroplasmin and RNaseH domain-containing protein
VSKYSTLFASVNNPGKSPAAQPFVIHPQSSKGDVAMSKPASTATTHTTAVDSTATTHAKPETATKKVKEPQKRGRKGDKITVALTAIPLVPVSVDSFINQYGVSLAVLRQSKRFIAKLDTATQASIGQVNVRQDKTTKQLMIWRETK